ncbi:MAG: acyltransferase, partial [Actinomycetota bacterium]|nr:acyltransferase [Actinomycetota bacterium]
MGEGSSIGHFTACRGLDLLRMGDDSHVGTFNWIVGQPSGSRSAFFSEETGRCPQLVIGSHSAITTRHYLDCTSPIVIG